MYQIICFYLVLVKWYLNLNIIRVLRENQSLTTELVMKRGNKQKEWDEMKPKNSLIGLGIEWKHSSGKFQVH